MCKNNVAFSKISSKRCKVINIIRNFVAEKGKKHESTLDYIYNNAWNAAHGGSVFYSRALQLRVNACFAVRRSAWRCGLV